MVQYNTNASEINGVAVSGTPSSGQLLTATSATAAAWQIPGMGALATTGVTGYTLANGTGNIITWTAPNDGNMHRVLLLSQLHVTSAQTGGICTLSGEFPDTTAKNAQIYGGGAAGGLYFASYASYLMAPNSTLMFAQTSAQSAGAAVLWAEFWGS